MQHGHCRLSRFGVGLAGKHTLILLAANHQCAAVSIRLFPGVVKIRVSVRLEEVAADVKDLDRCA